MIGTHAVALYPAGTEEPAGEPIALECQIESVSIVHGRADTSGQPDASSATIDLIVTPDAQLPASLDVGAWVTVSTTIDPDIYSTRFVGRVTDLAVGWDEAGAETPDVGLAQVTAVGVLADYGRRVVGGAVTDTWPQELDGARVARVLAQAGTVLDPITSDPGIVNIVPRLEPEARPALELAQDVAGSAGGLLWATRSGEIRYADTDHRRGAAVKLDLNACNILVTPTWQRNVGGMVNDATVTYGIAPEGGDRPTYHAEAPDSKTRFGLYEYTAETLLADRSDAEAAVGLILSQNSFPVWMLQALPVDVAGLDHAETGTLLGLDVHDLIRVTGLPATGGTPTSAAAWIEGWTETLAYGVHDLELSVSDYCRTAPPPRWNDVPAAQTWDTTPATLTWNQAACTGGPPADLGYWDSVPASTRWDQVPPETTWDTWGAA